MKSSLVCLLLIALTACGGGGGGSTSSATGGGTGGGTGTGGATGGGTGGGTGGASTSPFSFDVGVGGSGGIVGPVQRFGSVVVNDLVMNTDNAEFFIEGESGTQDDLSEGQQVVIAGDIGGLEAEEVVYRSNLRGVVNEAPNVVDALLELGELTVLGQRVSVSAETRYRNTTLETLAQDDLVEVSGTIGPDGVVNATYVEKLVSLTEFKAIGTISSLAANGSTFELNGLTVDATAASLDDIEGDMLANGQLVEVRFPASAPGSFLEPVAATEIEGLPVVTLEEGAEIDLDGVVDRFVSNTDFDVDGIPVTTDATTVFEDGAASLLVLDAEVEVEGEANAQGVILAEVVRFEGNDSVRFEGTMSAVDLEAGVITTVLGLEFRTAPFTEFDDDLSGVEPFGLADLEPGDYLEIIGFLDGDVVIATDVEREAPDTEVELRGRVTGFDEAAGTVEVLGVTVAEDEAVTSYEDLTGSGGRSAFYGDIVPGLALKVVWRDFVSATTPATSLSLEEDES